MVTYAKKVTVSVQLVTKSIFQPSKQNKLPMFYDSCKLEWTFEHKHSDRSRGGVVCVCVLRGWRWTCTYACVKQQQQPRSYLHEHAWCLREHARTRVHANIMRVLQNALCRQPTHIAPRQSPVVYKHKFSQHKPQNGSRRIHQPTLR